MNITKEPYFTDTFYEVLDLFCIYEIKIYK